MDNNFSITNTQPLESAKNNFSIPSINQTTKTTANGIINFNIVKQNLTSLIESKLMNLNITNYQQGDKPIATSLIGTPVYSNLVFQSGTTQDPATGVKTSYPSLRVDSAVMQVEGGKSLIKTEIQGRDWTVKEFIANKDYTVNISGYLISNVPNQTPLAEKNSLIALCNAKTSVSVTSSFLNDFGIYNIVLENYSIDQKQGFINLIPFSITASSDLPYDLEIEQQ